MRLHDHKHNEASTPNEAPTPPPPPPGRTPPPADAGETVPSKMPHYVEVGGTDEDRHGRDGHLAPYDDDNDSVWSWTTSINPQGRIDVAVDLSAAVSTHDLETLQEFEGGEEVDLDTLTADECPPLNIVIFIVGSRGDVQPYVALALELIRTRGHRVRIATHATFAKMVTDAGARLSGLTDARGEPLTGRLEHFNIGGDPQELVAYMVKNPGLIPGLNSLTNGDIGRKRKMVKEMLEGCYLACFSPNESTKQPFGADAIISNPPAFAHIHVAEALGIPLLMSFTMPWTPTTSFPHPLVLAKSSRGDKNLNNYASFVLADALMWQGLGDLINDFQYQVLGLRPLSIIRGPLVLQRLQIPYTYAWSEHLLPKPDDWKGNTDVVGFYSLESDISQVKPDPELVKFLEAGEPPIYIGFGSVVVDKPDQLTNIILNAVERTGVRALVSAGWADLGASDANSGIPSSVFIIKGNVPHDWLFAEGRVMAVCHHGGAGTTSAGLRLGLPTIIVPFFGDQWFWGNAVHHAGAGPAPIPYTELTVDKLVKAIEIARAPATQKAAQVLGESITAEDGVREGVNSFHKHLPLLNMRCDIDESQVAVWWSKAQQARLSAGVAAVLVEERAITWRDLEPHRPVDYDATRHYTDPFASFGQSILNLGTMSVVSTGELFYAPVRGLGGLVWGVPKASFDVVSSLQEGLENVPGMLGAQMRKRGKVDSFASGIDEGVKGMAYGLYDGITGLVTEPYKGAQKDGFEGFVKGGLGSVMSIGPRLAGAGLGLVVHPATGTYRSIRSSLGKSGILEHQSVMYAPRQVASHHAAGKLSREERHSIVAAWARLCSPAATDARRAEHEARALAGEQRLLAQQDHAGAAHLTGAAKRAYDQWNKGKSVGSGNRSGSGGDTPQGKETPLGGGTPRPSSPPPSAGEKRESSYIGVGDDKVPRWREQLAAGRSEPSPAEYNFASPSMHDVKHNELREMPTRDSTTSSTSTADVANAGIERWATGSTASMTNSTTDSAANSTVLQTPRTEVSSLDGSTGRTYRKPVRGPGRKHRN